MQSWPWLSDFSVTALVLVHPKLELECFNVFLFHFVFLRRCTGIHKYVDSVRGTAKDRCLWDTLISYRAGHLHDRRRLRLVRLVMVTRLSLVTFSRYP